MKRIGLYLALVAMMALGTACSKKEGSDLVGKWVGKGVMSDEDWARVGGGSSAEDIAAAKQLVEAVTFQLEIRDDGTYTLSAMGLDTVDTWAVNGAHLTLASSGSRTSGFGDPGDKPGGFKMTSTPNKKPMDLTISSDKSTLTQKVEGSLSSTVVYTRG